MSMLEVYEALEKSEGGSVLIDKIKSEIAVYKDTEAKYRLKEKELLSQSAKSSEAIAIYEKLKTLGMSIEEIESLKPAKTESDLALQRLQKQMGSIEELLKKEKEEKLSISITAQKEKLKNELSKQFKPIFGDAESLISENLVDKGRVRFSEKGAIEYENEVGVFSGESLHSAIKSDYKSFVQSASKGSGTSREVIIDKSVNKGFDKMSSLELMELSLK